MQSRGRCFAEWPGREQKAMYVHGNVLYLSLSLQQNCLMMFKWNRLLIEAVESLFLNILKAWQDTVLMLCSTLLWAWSYCGWSPEGAFNFSHSGILWLCWIIKSVPVPSYIGYLWSYAWEKLLNSSSWWIVNTELAWMFSAVFVFPLLWHT